MLDFMRWVLNRREHTKDTARTRLHQALLQDRLSISPGVMEAMKLDILAAVSRYLVVGEDFVEFEIRHSDESVVLISNLPVKEFKRLATPQ